MITKLGDPLGKACIAPAAMDLGVLVADVVRARLTHQWTNAQFLCSQINSEQVIAQFENETKGTTRPRVNLTKIRALRVRLCPQAEQVRIVEKLEEVLSDLDAGVAELKAAQKKLAKYRQSLLKAAVDGTLTASWREAQRQQSGEPKETGAQLLERILIGRRARWEAKELAKFTEQGKVPPNGWQSKYVEPCRPEKLGLSTLPEGWVYASLDQLAFTVRNGLSQKPSADPTGYRILRINSVRPMSVDLHEVRYLSISPDAAAAYCLAEGDLLVTRYNGSVDLLGVFGVVRGLKEQTLHPDKLIRIQPAQPGGFADWIEICAAVGVSRKHIVERVKTTAGQTGISGEDIKKMPVPLAPSAEQRAVVDTVAAALCNVAAQRRAIEVALKQAAAQRQNILKCAFAGLLVPQDPNDEPASVLLERIRAERATRAANTTPRTRKPKTPA